MMNEDRRAKVRNVKSGLQTVHVTFLARPNYEQTIPCRLVDISEQGCGLRSETTLATGTLVRVTGDLRSDGRDVLVEGKVSWSRPAATGRGCQFGVIYSRAVPKGGSSQAPGHATSSGPAASSGAQADSASKDWGPPPPASNEQPGEERPDYYEVLQLNPAADADMVQRVYRLLAQRFHPDNKDTGSEEKFRQVLEAYQTLSDPERRAKYDVDYRAMKRLQWRIFDQASATGGVEGEKAKRRGILSLLYTKRRNMPDRPAVGLVELEEILGIPRDHLEFTLWYLKEAGYVVRSDNARYIITIKGVDFAEESGSWTPSPDRLIESPEAIARRTAAMG